MNIVAKQQAIQLRKKGYLFSEIAERLGVAKSTVFVWTSSLPLSISQKNRAHDRLMVLKRKNAVKLTEAKRQKVREQAALDRKAAQDILKALHMSVDYKKLLCAALFWCEGEKDVTSGVRFINSDPLMVKKFLALLRESFNLDEAKFRALVHLHDYHDVDTQQKYWSELTGIPLVQFHKPYQKCHTGKQTKAGYQGCISVRYGDAALGRLLKATFIEYSKSV